MEIQEEQTTPNQLRNPDGFPIIVVARNVLNCTGLPLKIETLQIPSARHHSIEAPETTRLQNVHSPAISLVQGRYTIAGTTSLLCQHPGPGEVLDEVKLLHEVFVGITLTV